MAKRDINLGRNAGIKPAQVVTARFNEIRRGVDPQVQQAAEVLNALGQFSKSAMNLGTKLQKVDQAESIQEGRNLRLEEERLGRKKAVRKVTNGNPDDRSRNIYVDLGYNEEDGKLLALEAEAYIKDNLNNDINNGTGVGATRNGGAEAAGQYREKFLEITEQDKPLNQIQKNSFYNEIQKRVPGIVRTHNAKVQLKKENDYKENFSTSLINTIQQITTSENEYENTPIELLLLEATKTTTGINVGQSIEEIRSQLKERNITKAVSEIQRQIDEGYLINIDMNKIAVDQIIKLATDKNFDAETSLRLLTELKQNGAPLSGTKYAKSALALNKNLINSRIAIDNEAIRTKRINFEAKVQLQPHLVTVDDIRNNTELLYNNDEKTELEQKWLESSIKYNGGVAVTNIRDESVSNNVRSMVDGNISSTTYEEYILANPEDKVSKQEWKNLHLLKVNEAATAVAQETTGKENPTQLEIQQQEATFVMNDPNLTIDSHVNLLKSGYTHSSTGNFKTATIDQENAFKLYRHYRKLNGNTVVPASKIGITEKERDFYEGVFFQVGNNELQNLGEAIEFVSQNYKIIGWEQAELLGTKTQEALDLTFAALDEQYDGFFLGSNFRNLRTEVGGQTVYTPRAIAAMNKIMDHANGLMLANPTLDKNYAVKQSAEFIQANYIEFGNELLVYNPIFESKENQKQALEDHRNLLFETKEEKVKRYKEEIVKLASDKKLQDIINEKVITERKIEALKDYVKTDRGQSLLEKFGARIGLAFKDTGNTIDTLLDGLQTENMKVWSESLYVKLFGMAEAEGKFGKSVLSFEGEVDKIEDTDKVFIRLHDGKYKFFHEDEGAFSPIYLSPRLQDQFYVTPEQLARRFKLKNAPDNVKQQEEIINKNKANNLLKILYDDTDVDTGIPEELIEDRADDSDVDVDTGIPRELIEGG